MPTPLILPVGDGWPQSYESGSPAYLMVSPVAIGDVLVLGVGCADTSAAVSTVTGGGVATWVKAVGYLYSASTGDAEIWYGVVTSLTPAYIVVTGPPVIWLACQEYTAVWLARAEQSPVYSPAQAANLKKAFDAELMNFETAYNIGEAYRVQSFDGG